MTITHQTTLADLEQWANDVRNWPCKPSSVDIKFLAHSRTWNTVICMVGQLAVIGVGRDVVTSINDALAKVEQ